MKIKFHKMHGLGNDFIIIDKKENEAFDLNERQIRFLCDRKIGIGCDQLVILKEDGVLHIMEIYNADGSEVIFCGNATRCVVGLLAKSDNEVIYIKTANKILKTSKSGDLVTIEIGTPKLEWDLIPLQSPIQNNEIIFDYIGKGFCINVGNSHIVFFVENFNFDIKEIGAKVNADKIFPKGINVNFVKIIDRENIEVRTYERGVGLTDACGSGASASCFVAYYKNLINNKAQAHFARGFLEISIDKHQKMLMSGGYNYVFSGEVSI